MPTVVKALGTGERPGQNMLSLIPGEELVYRNEIAPIGTQSYSASVSQCRAALRAVDGRGEPWVGVGYSLGAAALGDFVMLDRPQHCVGIVLVADPLRARGQVSNSGVPHDRYGVAGERPISGVTFRSYAIADDPITACPADNGMRLFANVVTGRQQPLNPRMYWDAGYTIAWMYKYLRGDSRHIVYGSERLSDGRTYVEAARDAVKELAR